MDQKQVREKIEEIIDKNVIGILSTVENEKPYARYMTFLNKDLTLYTPTSSETYKVEEIDKNSNVHVLLGYQGEGFDDMYVEVTGKASIRDDENLIKDLWIDDMQNWFDGPNDPKLVMLEIKPESIRLMNSTDEPPHTLDL